MGISHSWNGTVLTITSDSGTSSADLKGDMGIRGPQGRTGLTLTNDGIIDTSGLATESYVDYATSGFCTEDYVGYLIDNAIDNIDIPEVDLSNYYNKEETEELVESSKPDLSPYALKTELPKDYALEIVNNASGEVISLTDSRNRELKGLTVYGKSVQRKTTGKNLLPNTATTQIFNGVTFTVNEDGSITANGTAAETNSFILATKLSFEAGKSYALSGCPEGGNGAFNLSIICPDGWVGHVETTGTPTNFVAKYSNYMARIYMNAGAVLSNVTFYPMIRSLSDFASDSTYEPYTGGKPSPSPEYPQELKSVGNVNVTVGETNIYLATENGLPGIPVTSGGNYTDSTGQQWICDYVDFETGQYVQRVQRVVFDGSEAWYSGNTVTEGLKRFVLNDALPKASTPSSSGVIFTALCDKLTFFNGNDVYSNTQGIALLSSGAISVYINSCAGGTTDQFKTFLADNPLEILYPLSNHSEYPLSEIDPDALAQYAALHTNYPNTTIYTDRNAGLKVDYTADTKLYIDNKFNELAKAIIAN
jgi:hypothetical protein